MNDLNLREVIKDSIKTLSEIQGRLPQNSYSPNAANERQFINTYNVWDIRCNLRSELSDAIFLIDCVKKQYDELQRLQRLHYSPMEDSNSCDSNEQKHRFKIERTLAVTTYLTTTWSLYDKLSNVIGRLLSGDNALKNPLSKENPKLIGTFIGYQSQKNDKQNENKKIIHTIGINNIVSDCFGEYICLSYSLRNCFVHEGGTIGKTPIFTGEQLDGVFDISESVAIELNNEIESLYSIKSPTIAKAGNLIELLDQCHYEINKCFIALLMFAIGAFRIQVGAFLSINENLQFY